MSSAARSVRCRACRALLAQFVVEHVERCSPVKSSSLWVVVLRATYCAVGYVPHCSELRLVTLSPSSKVFVPKAKRSSYHVSSATKPPSCRIRNRTLRYINRYCLRTLLSLWSFLYRHERLLVSFEVFGMCSCEQIVREHVLIFP